MRKRIEPSLEEKTITMVTGFDVVFKSSIRYRVGSFPSKIKQQRSS